ncbi:MAG: D-alanyl-D-alanine carboxypeptidase/D-alanyl-D-alanine-endopeptidase [Candidatus Nanopelagicales bacterium]
MHKETVTSANLRSPARIRTRAGLSVACSLAVTAGVLGPVAAASQAVAAPAAKAPAPAKAKAKDPEAAIIKKAQNGSLYTAGKSLYGPLTATRATVSTASAHSRIKRLVGKRLKNKAVGKTYSYVVTDVATGKSISGRGSRTGRLTASTMKIMTASAALQTFGPDYQFSTKVVVLGKGKVALVGGGDATLTRSNLSTLSSRVAKELKKDAAKGDASTIAPEPGKALELYVDDSMYVAPSKPGGWTNSYQPYIVRPVRALGTLGYYGWDSTVNAANYFRDRLKVHLKNSGIKYTSNKNVTRTRAAKTAQVVSDFKGVPLSSQIYSFLQPSENNIGEMLFRNVAHAKGYSTSWAGSRTAVRNVLSRELKIPLANTRIDDGSGVARTDRLTPIALTTALRRAADRKNYPKLWPIYYGGSLPLSGRTGTLSSGSGRFNTRPTVCARGKVRAKTGTLFDTIGLAGLTVGRDGKLKAFAFLVNKRPQRYSPLQTRRIVDRGAATVNGCY